MASIMIVDDDATLIDHMATCLRMKGFYVDTAPAPEQALNMLSKMDPLPDLIISDRSMPHMNGLEFCRRVKSDSRLRGIHVIICTAAQYSTDLEEVTAAGANDIIEKPFDLCHLLEKIKLHIPSSGGSHAA